MMPIINTIVLAVGDNPSTDTDAPVADIEDGSYVLVGSWASRSKDGPVVSRLLSRFTLSYGSICIDIRIGIRK